MSLLEADLFSFRSFSDVEKDNEALRLQLQKAEETIRALRRDAADNAAHRRMEESLRQSEARLEMELADTKLLQTISGHLIHEERIDALYTRITQAAVTIMQSDFGTLQMYYPERGAHGQLHMLAQYGLSQEGQDFWAWVDSAAGTTCAVAMRTGKRFMSSDMFNCEYVVGTPDHAMFVRADVRAAQSTPLFSRNGRLLGMISTHWTRNHTPSERDLNLLDILARQAADLIERKMAEEALQQSRAALIEDDKRKDEFLATLAHELRNPLSPITYALQILRTETVGSDVRDLLTVMDRQATHLVRLIDDLLDISRIRQGKITLRRERIALQRAVQDATDVSRQLIDNKSHRLTVSLPDEPVWIHADLTRVAQVIGNLLTNAAKFTPQGGHIAVSVHSEDNCAVLSVADTGQGIAADMLPKIFELFAQVDSNLERSQGGLGIGLALVRQLLEMHGGQIEAKSAGINRGCTFTMRLPLVA